LRSAGACATFGLATREAAIVVAHVAKRSK
jgi:hypothetical protein